MRIPFFSLRRKSKQNAAPKKSSLMCCLHSPTVTTLKLPTPGSEMTTVIRESSSSSSGSSRRNTAFHLRRNSVTRIKTHTSDVERTPPPPPVRPVKTEFTMARSVSSLETEEAASPLSRLEAETTPSSFRSIGRRSPRKGPGLGSVDDSPPTRMTFERPTSDLLSISRPVQRRDSAGAQAPQLPTRLEVCVDRNRRKTPNQPLLTDSAISMNSDKSLGSHPLTAESLSPLRGSVSPRHRSRSPAPTSRSPKFRSCSPAMNMHRTQSPCQMMNIFNAGSSRSRSPGPSSRRSSESHPEEMNNQPSKQTMRTKWDWDEQGMVAPCEMEMQPSLGLEERAQPHGVRDAIPRLHRWQIHLKLDWVSETSNDLVAEVRLTDSRTPLATTSSESSDQSHFSEISPNGMLDSARSKRRLKQMNSSEAVKTNQSNVVYIVDRVLSELQKQKRKARNKERTGGIKHHRSRNDGRMRGPYQTDDQTFSFRRELSPEAMSPGQRRQRRQEVLQAFDVLITKMESRISTAGALGKMADTVSERRLTEAVFCDLREEVSRLQREMSDRGSSGENNAWTMALCNFMPFASTQSHKAEQSDDDEEFSFHRRLKEKKIRSVPVEASLSYLPITFPETETIETTFSCLTELQSAPQSPLNRSIPNKRDGAIDRLAKIALLNEEMLLMNGTNMDACFA